MKQGFNSINDLAVELQNQLATKKDYIVPTSFLSMTIKEKKPIILGANHAMGITGHAHGQIAGRLGIPLPYYNKMLEESPELLAQNVNHWFKASTEKRMLRTLLGNVRAFLSDRFRPLDHFDLVQVVLPHMLKAGCKIVSCALTETKMYIKAVAKTIRAEVKKGDVVEAGVVVSNSEVGSGALLVDPFINRLVCDNGLIIPDSGVRKHHLGKLVDETNELYTRKTIMAANRALFMKVNDVVSGLLNHDSFTNFVKGMQIAADQKITRNPVEVVEDVSGKFQLTDMESGGIIQHLVAGGDLSKWGLVNAITRASADVDDYDRATDLERVGGQLLNVTDAEWHELAKVA